MTLTDEFCKAARIIRKIKPRNHIAPFAAKRKAGKHWMSCRKAARQDRRLLED